MLHKPGTENTADIGTKNTDIKSYKKHSGQLMTSPMKVELTMKRNLNL
jgi:hypothetical protein